MGRRSRAVTPVISTILLVAIAVILAATVSVFALGFTDDVSAERPVVSVSYDLVPDGGEQTIAITNTQGDPVEAAHLTVVGSTDVDVGGPPGTGGGGEATERFASPRERFDEGGDQVGVGDAWEAGETVHVDPVGSVEDVTVRFVWSEQPVTGVNPGSPEGKTTHVIAKVTVGE